MQPNTYLQPNTYYQVQQPPKPTKTKKNGGLIAIIILLLIALIALGAYFLIDKFILSHPKDVIVNDLSDITINTPLSDITAPEDAPEDAFKNVLAGRTFVVNEIADQYLTFKNNSEYSFSYYHDPSSPADVTQNIPSEDNGTFTVNQKTINLSGGDSFTITNDYLIKTSDRLSSNKNTIYFDSLQLPNFKKSLTNALTTNLKSLQKKDTKLLAVQKTTIKSYACTQDRTHMTNADNYICRSTFDVHFNTKDIENLITAEKLKDFTSLCSRLVSGYNFTNYVDSCTIPDKNLGQISTWSNLIVRVKSRDNYEITGSYHQDDENLNTKDTKDSKSTNKTK